MARPKMMRERVELDKDVYELALERAHYCFEMFDHIAVAFSGGKDSTCVLEIALEVAEDLGRLPLHVVHYDEEAIPYETEDYVRRRFQDPRLKVDWYCVPIRHYNATSRSEPHWFPWDPDCPEKWVRPMPPEGLTEMPGLPIQPPTARLSIPDANGLLFPPEQYGDVGFMLGIRAAESLTRYRAVVRRDVDNYIIHFRGGTSKGNISKIYPVYDWSTQDVWSGIAQKGWDYNEAYDQMEMAGIPMESQRCAPPFGTEPMQGLSNFKKCWPNIWDKMVERVNGAATAARYSKTELYNFGKQHTSKPENVSWEDFLAHFIRKFPEDVQRPLAQRIKEEIKSHYRSTTDPILDATGHPLTGLSWNFLWTLASRSDPKNRKIASTGMTIDAGSQARADHWDKYELEKRMLIEAGKIVPGKRYRGVIEDPVKLAEWEKQQAAAAAEANMAEELT